MRFNLDAGETSAGAALLTMLGAAYRFLNPTRDRLDRIDINHARLEDKVDKIYLLLAELKLK